MYFTRQTEIAISIITTCSQQSGDTISTRQMADRIGIRKDYAAKTVSMLVRNGLLHSERGRDGGISLAVDPKGLTLGAVLRITQPALAGSGKTKHRAGSLGSTFDLVLKEASSNLISIADQYIMVNLSQHDHCKN